MKIVVAAIPQPFAAAVQVPLQQLNPQLALKVYFPNGCDTPNSVEDVS